jgi:nitroreductase
MQLNYMPKIVITVAMITIGLIVIYLNKKRDKPASHVHPIAPILAQRHSGHAYDASRCVSCAQIASIVQAARLTPSSFNDQPWYCIVCDRTTNKPAYDKALSTLMQFNQGWAQSASALIIVVASINSRKNGYNRWAQFDTGAAALSMSLQATSLGLMAHQIGGFYEKKIRNAFGIPKNFMPLSVIAIGYAAPNHKRKAKERKPVEENFFDGYWGLGFNQGNSEAAHVIV